MRGAPTVRSPLKVLAVLAATSAVLFTATAFNVAPAEAHEKDKASKQRRHLVRRAKHQLGTPYSYGGTSPRGFDCSGFTRWVFRRHGHKLPHSSDYQFSLRKRDGYRGVWRRSKLKRGDLVFFDTGSGRIGHVGVYKGHGKFISATSSRGVRKDRIRDPYYWGPRWVAAVRTPGTRGGH